MKRLLTICLSLLSASVLFLSSCKSEKEEFVTESINDYIPLVVGKYITYRVDSMVFTAFGSITEIHKYQVKHIVDSKFTDLTGRPTYRVYTFIRDSVNASSWTASQPWINSGTYYVAAADDQIELNENNLRVIKLHMPMRTGFSWHGNRYLADNPYDTAGYKFSNDDNMEDWNFTYQDMGASFSFRNMSYANVTTVSQVNETFLPDTVEVVNNQVIIPDTSTIVWIKGAATTATITVSTQANTVGRKLSLFNISNKPIVLNNISTPVGFSRNYEYKSSGWGFGNDLDKVTANESSYGSKSFGLEKYAKGVGLVYKQFIMWEHQPNTGGSGGPYKVGFGITMWMIDHN